MRGFIAVTVAPGGVGKSQLAMAMALASATGLPILGHYVHHRVNAWIINLEDPLDEMDRRLAALMLHHQIDEEHVSGRLFMNSGRDRSLTIAKIAEDGSTVIFPDKDAIIAEGRANQIAHLVVDPYVRSHELDENNNTQQAAAASAWADVADALAAGIHLVHHTRKGAVTDIEASRGAKALTDHARSGLLLMGMSEQEAADFNIPSEKRYSYIRLDDAKANMAPRAEKADWFHLEPLKLGNGTPDYPNGDTVTAIEPWKAPSVWKEMTPQGIGEVLDKLAAGPSPGILYSPSNRGAANTRWAGIPIMQIMQINETQASGVVKTWIQNGLLVETVYRDPTTRKDAKGLTVDRSKTPSC